MEITKNVVEPTLTPPPTYTLTLTEAEARTLKSILARTVSSDIDKIFTNACDGHVWNIVGDLYYALGSAGVEGYNVTWTKHIGTIPNL